MTEEEWLTTSKTGEALQYLSDHQKMTRTKAGRRKLRLFACACIRRAWDSIPEGIYRQVVEGAERLADGLIDEDEVDTLLARCAKEAEPGSPAVAVVLRAVTFTLHREIRQAARYGSQEAGWGLGLINGLSAYEAHQRGVDVNVHGYNAASIRERAAQMPLLRDIIGNPFRPVALAPVWVRWNDRTIPNLAKAIYDEQAYDRLGILADALTDAGCNDEAILAHCRGDGPHVRGCWVVDSLMGK